MTNDLSQGVTLQHDNAAPHSTCQTPELLQSLHLELLFGPLNKHLKGHQFHSNEEVDMAVCEWLWM
jgi:hypothetical protein